eukprot:jgi/Psemu1/20624/gm1.20624_g
MVKDEGVYPCQIDHANIHSEKQTLLQYNFAVNESWLNVKLLTNCNNSQNQDSISNQAFAKSTWNACKSLGILSKHFVHFGCGSGAVVLEMQEVDLQYIKMIGNWNPDPLLELCWQVSPFLDAAINTIGGQQKPRPQAFLKLPQFEICCAAGRRHLDPSRNLFHQYQAHVIARKVMVEMGVEAVSSINWSMDHALPGIGDCLHNIHSKVYNASQDITGLVSEFRELKEEQYTINNHLKHSVAHGIVLSPDNSNDGSNNNNSHLTSSKWFGLGNFINFPGRIEELHKMGNHKWRKHFSTVEQKNFSRLKCIVDFVKDRAAAGESVELILEEGDQFMKANKKTLSTLHLHSAASGQSQQCIRCQRVQFQQCGLSLFIFDLQFFILHIAVIAQMVLGLQKFCQDNNSVDVSDVRQEKGNKSDEVSNKDLTWDNDGNDVSNPTAKITILITAVMMLVTRGMARAIRVMMETTKMKHWQNDGNLKPKAKPTTTKGAKSLLVSGLEFAPKD